MPDSRRHLPVLRPTARVTTRPRPAARRQMRQWATTPDSVQAWALYIDGVKVDLHSLETATERAKEGEGFVWLGLKDPTDEDMARFARQFDLHPLAIEDAVEGHTRSKLEQFDDTLFCVISTVAYVDHEAVTETSEIVSTGQIMIFVGENFLLTVRRGDNTPLRSLRRTLESTPEELSVGPAYVFYKILDRVVDEYMAVVGEFEIDIDEVEEDIFSRQGTKEIDRVYNLKRELIEFKRSVVPLAAPLQALSTRSYPVIPDETRAYFREVADHHTDSREAILSFDEVLSTILQAGMARISLEDNRDMRRLSAILGILAVPTTLGAVYGMNFDNMPELHSQYGYFVVLSVMLVGMVGCFLIFRHRRWI
ncbi:MULTISPECIES: magnesium/cobalt transporter CorA [unclassified Luteococcus]|uniref:magnesium/cobalt transporter CorA n=1 Tax=unclassified Luteococcus TaxID=2639923 RepID=UPI00313CB1C1